MLPRPRSPVDGAGAWLPGTGPTGFAGRGSRGSFAGGSTPGAGRVPAPGPRSPRLRPCPRGPRPTGCAIPARLAPRRRLPGRRSPRSALAVRIELRGTGGMWLGPEWGGGGGRLGGPDGLTWGLVAPAIAVGHLVPADLVVWTDRGDGVRVTRSALLLRGRRLAMISTLADARIRNGIRT